MGNQAMLRRLEQRSGFGPGEGGADAPVTDAPMIDPPATDAPPDADPALDPSGGAVQAQTPPPPPAVSALSANTGMTSLTLAHVPPCGAQPAIKFTAGPANAGPVTWTLAAGSATIATDTKLTPSKNTLSAELSLDKNQTGGTVDVKAENASGGQLVPFPLASHPTAIGSTSTMGNPTDTTMYGGVFDHMFTSNDGIAASLDQVAVGEKFPNVATPNAATHLIPTPFGNFTLQTGTLPNTPSGASGNWFMDSSGMLGGTHDTVGIQKTMIDIGRHLVSDSNPTPANPLPAGFTVDQQFFWWCPHGAAGSRWNLAAATTHTRRLRMKSGGGAEFVAIVNTKENAMDYEGKTGVTAAVAAPATAAPSPASGTPNTVQISATLFPSTATAHFSIQGAALGCTIDSSTGVLTIGTQEGSVKVRAADSAGGANWDEVDVTIVRPAAPVPAPNQPGQPAPGNPAPRAAEPADPGEPPPNS